MNTNVRNNRFVVRASLILAAGLVLALLPGSAIFAQDSGAIVTDEQSLFGDASVDAADDSDAGADTAAGSNTDRASESSLITDAGSSASAETGPNLENALLSADKVIIGGKYNFQAEASWYWYDINTFIDKLTEYDLAAAGITLSADVLIDARPTENFRVFLKTGVSYPFSASSGVNFSDVFHVKELFSDFNWDNRLFFRAGKQTLNWGVGYFFSPANLLNITQKDPEDPEAELEGPVSLKVNFPFDAHNLYLYVIAQDITLPKQYGVAVKGEFVAGPAEFGIGGLYQADIPPAVMATVSTAIGDIDVFGEGVIRRGSMRNFVVEDADSPLGFSTTVYEDKAFFSGTAGAMYSYSNDADTFNFSIAGQYYYNGEGYADPSILTDNQAAVGALLQAGSLTASDLMRTGRHYAAISTGLNDIGKTGISFSVFWMQNFNDLSGMVTPTLSWQPKPVDEITVALKVPMTYGEAGKELSRNGNTIGVSLNFSFGGGTF